MLAIMGECGCHNLETTSSFQTTLVAEVNKGTFTTDIQYTLAIPSILDDKCDANLVDTCDFILECKLADGSDLPDFISCDSGSSIEATPSDDSHVGSYDIAVNLISATTVATFVLGEMTVSVVPCLVTLITAPNPPADGECTINDPAEVRIPFSAFEVDAPECGYDIILSLESADGSPLPSFISLDHANEEVVLLATNEGEAGSWSFNVVATVDDGNGNQQARTDPPFVITVNQGVAEKCKDPL